MKLTYGDIEGSVRLRSAIAALYDELPIEQITITHGTIAANMLVHKTLLGRGDQVVSVVPTYQQHYSIPASLGAEVRLLKLQEHDGFLPDLERLKTLVTRETKLIALTNPNNPTGALIERPMLEEIVDIADSVGAAVLCDESIEVQLKPVMEVRRPSLTFTPEASAQRAPLKRSHWRVCGWAGSRPPPTSPSKSQSTEITTPFPWA